MKIERLSDNTISCTLSSFDLSVRNLNIRELAYGSEKAKKLFNEMMSRASAELGFDTHDSPVMIEAIPLSSDSIRLIISKVTDPEELDARFSRFTQNPAAGGMNKEQLSRITAAFLENAGHAIRERLERLGSAPAGTEVTDPFGFFSGGGSKPPVQDDTAEGGEPGPDPLYSLGDFRAVRFEDLDSVISAAGAVRGLRTISSLYRHPAQGDYALTVRQSGDLRDDFTRTVDIVGEYGRIMRTIPGTQVYYEEHYTPVIRNDALGKLADL